MPRVNIYKCMYVGARVAAVRLYNTDRIYKRLFDGKTSVGYAYWLCGDPAWN